MKSYLAFTKKEFTEYIRTYKALILISVFFVFGIISPVAAKMMPKLMSGVPIEGITITIPNPTSIDAYSQFFKNMTQMGLIVMLLIFSGTLSQELSRGTLINMLSKGLRRRTVILSKFTASFTLWTVSYAVSAITCYGYTIYLFKNSNISNLFFSLFCLWLFGCFTLSVIFISSTLTYGNFGGLILTAVILGVMLILNVFPKLEKFNPITLASDNLGLLKGTVKTTDLSITIWLTLVLTIILLVSSIVAFNKKKL
ncbi:ABC transporter permease [Clostridium oryzae]|uniref:ABC-2 family transporter protein n=1 Tax=Clostridium oryzae TaxID=1450648 RepID=A0A1V4IXY4_9CLOT|nr:ABC transporter permease subunit [Clostridium oryzae]OPJ64635.1 ABC-2 family transporter protein [Clostridium oryzae]